MTNLKVKFLACFPKVSDPAEELRLMTALVLVVRNNLGIDPHVVNSRDWFSATFPSATDYTTWIHDTVNGREYLSRSPHFNGFVFFSRNIGLLNAQIARKALHSGKVALLLEEGKLFSVEHVETRDPSNWVNGTVLYVRAIQGD